jgi:hypothetical protein
VGLRRWFFGLLTRGTPPVLDPSELVEFVTLPLFDATLLTEKLRNQGVDASCAESYNVATRTNANGRILVPRGQLNDAQKVVTAS